MSYERRRKELGSGSVPGFDAVRAKGRWVMTKRDQERGASPSRRGMFDPAWEDALRAGQTEEGGAGSVEPELAIIHLLRHARAPESLGDDAMAKIWQDIDSELASAGPLPWWRRGWVLWGGTLATAAAAAAILVVVWPRATEHGLSPRETAIARAQSPAGTLERQFEMLAPSARQAIESSVDASRGTMRHELIDLAASSGRSAGGAP